MKGVTITPLAILLELDTVRIVLLVFLGRVIAALALSARQSDQRTHEFSFYRKITASSLYTHEVRISGVPAEVGTPPNQAKIFS